MNSELIIDVRPKEVSMAVLEDGRLVELQRESHNISFAVGNVYLGKVKKLMPGMNAAFVDIGSKKDAFLHYNDLGSTFESQQKFLGMLSKGNRSEPKIEQIPIGNNLPRGGSITDVLKPGQELLVQITKEPISSKGPRLTAELSFASRSLVLTPFADTISISNKIASAAERVRLKSILRNIKPKNYSVIIRTSAQEKGSLELHSELKSLVKRWDDNVKKLVRAKAPLLFFEESSRALSLLRDNFNPTYQKILINDKEASSTIRDYIRLIAPEKEGIIELYQNEVPIFDHYGITKQIKALFGRTVTYKSGAYLIIEHTEAMHVVDVNSGNRSKKNNEQEATAFDVNMAAAEELARQLRLRDMGGIIVVDFIDMSESKHRKQLHEHMVQLMANDKARHNIQPLSRFGVMEITRQRVRQSLVIQTEEQCPTCMGTGKSQASILFVDTLEAKVERMVKEHRINKFVLHVHPFVAAYLKKGLLKSIIKRWRSKYSKGIKLVPNESLAFLGYSFYDYEGNELDNLDE